MKRFVLLYALAVVMAALVMTSRLVHKNPATAAIPFELAPVAPTNNTIEAIQSYMDCATSPRGSWVLREDSFVLPAWFTHYPHRYCPNIPQAMTKRESNRTALYYTWRPPQESTCSDLETFSRERFCSGVRGRTIYAIGDSLTYGFFMNLRYLFSKFVGPDVSTHERAVLDCPFPFSNIKLQFIHTKKLEDIPKRNLTFDDDGIFVINTGAHFKETPELLRRIDSFLTSMQQQRYPNATFVWRSTPMGHDIKTYPGKVPFLSAVPLTSPPPPINLTSIALREPHYFPYHYSWHRFLEQNLKVKQMLAARHKPVLFLDVYHMDVLRIDGRIDGLHVCVPGVHMEWSMLLMNLLIKISG